MPLLKYVTLAVCLVAPASAMGITRRLDGSACVDTPDAVLPGGWDCGRIAEYIAGSNPFVSSLLVAARVEQASYEFRCAAGPRPPARDSSRVLKGGLELG